MAAVHPLQAAALVLVATILATSSATDSYVTYVSENGSNTTSCLLGGPQHPCHSLSYVMEHLLCNNNNLELHANYTVVITYSHVVSYGTCYIVRDINLTIAGIGNPQLILSATDSSWMIRFEYSGNEQLPGVNFTVSEIGLERANLTFGQISSLAFHNCTLQIGLVIDSSLLGFEQCLFTSLSEVHLISNFAERMQIVNSTFLNITAGVFIAPNETQDMTQDMTFELSITDSVFTGGAPPLFLFPNCVNCSVTIIIDGCHLANYPPAIRFPTALITILPTVNLSFNCTNSIFMNNQAGILDLTAGDLTSIYIRNCTFQRNSPGKANVINIAGVFIAPNETQDMTIELSITDSVFTGGAPPLFLFANCVNCSVTVIIDGCHLANHPPAIRFPTALITILPTVNLSFNCTNSIFMNNQAGIIAVITGDLISIYIRNCTFQGNSPENANVIHVRGGHTQSMHLTPSMQLTMDSVTVDSSSLPLAPSVCCAASSQPIAVLLQDLSLHISNTTFSNNHGTALGLSNVNINIHHKNVSFVGNIGSSGGAVALLGWVDLVSAQETVISFVNNTAIFGGAIYVYKCATEFSCPWKFGLPVHFEGNYATISGDSIYFEEPSVVPGFINPLWPFHYPDRMTTSPTTVAVNNPIRMFPGQKISFEANVTDHFSQASSCIADAYLQCGKHYFCKELPIRLKGPAVTLSNGSVGTDLTIEVLTQSVQLPLNVSLHMKCRNTQAHEGNVTVPLHIENCPLGYKALHSDNATTCQCYSDEHIRCDPPQAVCIQFGYWFGNDSRLHYISAKCQFTFCTANSTFCSPNLTGYVLLPPSVDDQCSANRGGLLCTSCRPGFNFTFQAVQCVPKDHSHCANWMPPTILLLSVAFQFALAFSLVVALRLKMGLGSGFLYGPLFCLAVINQLPFGYLNQFSVLQTIISTYSSIFLLTMQVFGDIPWCFFDVNPLLNFSLRFLGPLIVAIVLLLTVCLARRCPRLLLMLQDSPVQAMCLLILLSFWSLADTSLRLIVWVPLQSGEVSETRVALFPEIQYLQNPYHISLWIVSIAVLLFFVCFAAMLAITPLLAKKYNLNKIKPLLDEFHSCYKNEYRWYSAVYFASWLVLQITSPYFLIFLTLLSILLSTHFIVRPYKNQWMDRMDTLLLTDLVLLTCLTRGSSLSASEDITFAVVLVYILALAPLLLITIGGIVMIAVRVKNVFKKTPPPPAAVRIHAVPDYHAIDRDRVPTQDVSVAGLRQFDEEREPLVRIMQQEDGDAT